jgi:hypothetical protein
MFEVPDLGQCEHTLGFDRPESAYSVEKLDSRFSCSNFGGLKPSPDSFASL